MAIPTSMLKCVVSGLSSTGYAGRRLIPFLHSSTRSSKAYIYALAESACLGAISTHDLELVTLADELTQIKNYNFRDEIVKGEMVFDYTLYPGPCPTTNALKIMQKEGLPITWKQVPKLEIVPASKMDN